MQPVILKVYGNLYPCPQSFVPGLDAICSNCYPPSDQLSNETPVIYYANELLRISFEGIYFPIEEVLSYLESVLTPSQNGKIDYLDLENWKMTRYLIEDVRIVRHSTSLNNVMDYSGF